MYPVVNYDYDYARDLYKFFDIEDLSELEIVEKYVIKEHDTLQSISNNLYDTPDYWWVNAIINGIKDMFSDFPKSKQSILNDVIKINGSFDNELYEQLMEINDNKREIYVIKRDYLEQFVTSLLTSMSVEI